MIDEHALPLVHFEIDRGRLAGGTLGSAHRIRLHLLHIVAGEPSCFVFEGALPPSSFNDLSHSDQVSLGEAQLQVKSQLK